MSCKKHVWRYYAEGADKQSFCTVCGINLSAFKSEQRAKKKITDREQLNRMAGLYHDEMTKTSALERELAQVKLELEVRCQNCYINAHYTV